MADPALLIKLHQKAQSTVSITALPEDLLTRAAYLGVVVHDAFVVGRIARAYYAWARADACLQMISQQARSHAPNIPLPFCNDNWSKAWVAVHQNHQGQRPKINEIEARLDPTDMQDTDDWDLDVYAQSESMDSIIEESTDHMRSGSASGLQEPGTAATAMEFPKSLSNQQQDASEDDLIPVDELRSLNTYFPLAKNKLHGGQLSNIWWTWQTVHPPPELLTCSSSEESVNPELATVIAYAREQLLAIAGTTRLETKSKGKGRLTVEWDPGEGSSREADFDRVTSVSPPSVFSHESRLSTQSRTSIDSGMISITTEGSRETAKEGASESGKKSRWPKLKKPLAKLVRRNTKQSDGKTARGSIFSTIFVTKECSSCFDDFSAAVSLECQHSYCKECFGGMVLSASSNEAQWPPRCCMIDIPRKLIAVNLTADQLKVYHAKEQEYSIKPNERWYCSNVPECGKFFIPKVRGEDTTTCIHCRHTMCSFCRGPAHPRGQRCTQDRNLEAMMQEAELEGWRQCVGCSAMVELDTGCRHITCRCGAQFCYTCGAVWRTCGCSESDQARRNEEMRRRRDEVRRLEHEREQAEQRAREGRDREAEELEAALEAVRQQQEADLAARQRAEEEEARRLEEHRLLSIELTFDELTNLLRQVGIELLENLRLRFAEEESSFTLVEEEIRTAIEWERQHLKDTHGKQEKETLQVKQRHESEMSAFKKKVERYILQKAVEMDDASDVSPLDRIIHMREQAGASYMALEEIQHEELAVLTKLHHRADESCARRHVQIEQDILRELDGKRLPKDTDIDSEGEARISELTQSLEDRRIEHATAMVHAFKWWECMNAICAAALLDRKAHLISTGADAPEVLGVVVPELPPEPTMTESAPELATTLANPCSGPSDEMPGSFPAEAPSRPPPGIPPTSQQTYSNGSPSLRGSLEDLEGKTQSRITPSFSGAVIARPRPTTRGRRPIVQGIAGK